MSGPAPSQGASRVLRVLARVVPWRARNRWLREWGAEWWYLDRHLREKGWGRRARAMRFFGVAMGAARHAFWLRVQSIRAWSLASHVRPTLRGYARTPGFTVAIISTLGLGLGATLAVFSIARGALLDRGPYPEPDRLGALVGQDPTRPGDRLRLAYPDVQELGDVPGLDAVAAYDWDPFNVRVGETTEWLGGGRVSAAFFDVLQVPLVQGRGFLPGEDEPGAPDVAVVGERLARRAFGGANPLGETLLLDGVPHQVIGVAPATIDLPYGAELWVPLRPTGSTATRESFWLQAVARRGPATVEQVQTALQALSRSWIERFPDRYEGRHVSLVDFHTFRTGDARPGLLALAGAVSLLLLVVCANLAGLVIARTDRRRPEFQVRLSVGGRPSQLVRQLVFENVLLSCAAGVAACGIAAFVLRGVRAATPDVPVWFRPSPDPVMVGFAIALALGAGLIMGLAPWLFGALRTNGGRHGRGISRARDVLIGGQVAVCTVLLLAAATLVHSLTLLDRQDPGFEARGRIAGTVQLPADRYGAATAQNAFVNEVLGRLRAHPGVARAAAVSRMPFQSGVNSVLWWEEGQSAEAFRENPQAELNSVTPAYFSTMGIELLTGRAFAESDNGEAIDVVVVNQQFAATHLQDRPLGRRISFAYPPRFFEVIGVVDDVAHSELGQVVGLQIYAPFHQQPGRRVSLVAQGRAQTTDGLGAAVRQAVASADPDLAAANLQDVEQVVRESVWRLRLLARAFALFGAFAALLAGMGIAGVIAQTVSRRTREIGIRVALGATARSVFALTVSRTAWVVALGLSLGVLVGLVGAEWAGSLTQPVPQAPPSWAAGVLLILGCTAFIAAAVPARRALRVDPVTALQSD